MGATSVKSRILDLLADVVVDNTAIGQFATDAAKEIINVLPLEMLWSMSTTTEDVSGAGASVTSARVLSVSRVGKTAREIPYSDRTRYTESGSIYKATNNSPVYYKQGGKVYVIPNTSSDAKVEHVNYPSITFSNDLSDFVGAPDEIEHLIIMKTAIKARLSELNEFQDDTEEHNLKMADLQLLQREYEGALATFIASYSRPSQQREEQ
jgi:hypothetical protein